MFSPLKPLIPDPILGLSAAFKQDPREFKIDLGVGVYKDESGVTPIMDCIKRAGEQLLASEETKAYQSPAGDAECNELIQKLAFGEPLSVSESIHTVQTPGGSGALKLAAELVKRSSPESVIWVSTPTWANHIPLLGSSGLTLKHYPYFDPKTNQVDFDAMMSALQAASSGDVVLLHGCCHNPTGADLNQDQWRTVAAFLEEKGLIPFVDVAYHGFGSSMDDDIFGVRLLAESVPEMLLAYSCSKNFGVYRERTGAVSVIGADAKTASVAHAHLQNIGREIYSMPPSHGAGLVRTVLASKDLTASWQRELSQMRGRIQSLREKLSTELASVGDFEFIREQKGMFSFLGLSETQVSRLRDEYGIYMTSNSRINIAGVSNDNIGHLAEAIRVVTGSD